MRMLDIALDCIARGWYVFPCEPRGKRPMVPGGFKSASCDEELLMSWWARWPDANVGIATGASGLTVLDIDHGISDTDDLIAFTAQCGIPNTYAVRTGRRPGFGVQLYFEGGDLRSIPWQSDEMLFGRMSGDILSATGYVLAQGCTPP